MLGYWVPPCQGAGLIRIRAIDVFIGRHARTGPPQRGDEPVSGGRLAESATAPRYGASVGRLAGAARLEQEPDAPLGFVDPVLEQARGRNVAIRIAQLVRLAHMRD